MRSRRRERSAAPLDCPPPRPPGGSEVRSGGPSRPPVREALPTASARRHPSGAAPPPRRVLVVVYSQTGQLERCARALVAPLEQSGFEVVWQVLSPGREFPFPWSLRAFLAAFPDCVLGRPPRLEPPGCDRGERFDLVVLCSQVWFLAPSLPVQAYLASDSAEVLRGSPVVTLIACRNMWHTAIRQIKKRLRERGAVHMDSVVITDSAPALATFVTTPRWLLTGRKDGFWGFPPAGISSTEVAGLSRLGEALVVALMSAKRPPGPALRGMGAAAVDRRFVITEWLGWWNFRFMAKILDVTGLARPTGSPVGLVLFAAWLVLSIAVLVPLGLLGRIVAGTVFRPAYQRYIRELLEPSG